MCGDRYEFVLPAPVCRHDIDLGQLGFDIVRIGTLFVHLVDCNDHRDTCCFGMRNRFLGLRHDTVICCNDDNNDIGRLCSTCTHLSKGFVARSINERDLLAVLLYLVGTHMLCNTARFSVRYFGRTDLVKKRCLTMVDVTHDRNDRRSLFKVCIFFGIVDLYIVKLIERIHRSDFHFELFSKDLNLVFGKEVILRYHHSEGKEYFDHFAYRAVHLFGELIDSYIFRDFH